jgi:hypothetical protein
MLFNLFSLPVRPFDWNFILIPLLATWRAHVALLNYAAPRYALFCKILLVPYPSVQILPSARCSQTQSIKTFPVKEISQSKAVVSSTLTLDF